MIPTRLGLVAIVPMVVMLALAFVIGGPCSGTKANDWTLQLALSPAPPRVGDAELRIDVRCRLGIESINGPAYSFDIEGDDVEVVASPLYDSTADVYRTIVRFRKDGTHEMSVNVIESDATEPFRSNELAFDVLPR